MDAVLPVWSRGELSPSPYIRVLSFIEFFKGNGTIQTLAPLIFETFESVVAFD
jgi:hypothetical protein